MTSLTFKHFKMEYLKTISGKKIAILANHSKRTFTIKTETAKYRTSKMDRSEFDSCLNNTGNDWHYFLKSNDYYTV